MGSGSRNVILGNWGSSSEGPLGQTRLRSYRATFERSQPGNTYVDVARRDLHPRAAIILRLVVNEDQKLIQIWSKFYQLVRHSHFSAVTHLSKLKQQQTSTEEPSCCSCCEFPPLRENLTFDMPKSRPFRQNSNAFNGIICSC